MNRSEASPTVRMLGLLTTLVAAGPVDPADARDQARQILEQKRFTGSRTPKPLRGILRWIGDRISPVTDPIGRFFARLADNQAAAALAIVVLVALVLLTAVLLVRRKERARVVAADEFGVAKGEPVDPEQLERDASTAEAEGRYEEALRLRFRAGLLRLARNGRLPAGHVEPSSEIARDLDSAEFDALSRTFDAVVYGRRPAQSSDATEARERWRAVLAESRR